MHRGIVRSAKKLLQLRNQSRASFQSVASTAVFNKGGNVCFQRHSSTLSFLLRLLTIKSTFGFWGLVLSLCFSQLTVYKVREEKRRKGERRVENVHIRLLGGHALGVLETPPSAISRCRDNTGLAHAPIFSAVQGFWKLTFHCDMSMQPHFQGDLKDSSFSFPNHLHISSWHWVAACPVRWPLELDSRLGYPTFWHPLYIGGGPHISYPGMWAHRWRLRMPIFF